MRIESVGGVCFLATNHDGWSEESQARDRKGVREETS